MFKVDQQVILVANNKYNDFVTRKYVGAVGHIQKILGDGYYIVWLHYGFSLLVHMNEMEDFE